MLAPYSSLFRLTIWCLWLNPFLFSCSKACCVLFRVLSQLLFFCFTHSTQGDGRAGSGAPIFMKLKKRQRGPRTEQYCSWILNVSRSWLKQICSLFSRCNKKWFWGGKRQWEGDYVEQFKRIKRVKLEVRRISRQVSSDWNRNWEQSALKFPGFIFNRSFTVVNLLGTAWGPYFILALILMIMF